MTITYIFWDSDNTLVDTHTLHWRKHCVILAEHGIILEDSDQNTIYHNNGAQNWEWLNRDRGLQLDCATYLDAIDNWYMTHLHEAEIRSGISQALNYFQEKNIPQSVVSNGRRRSVMAALDAKNLAHYFEFILCKEDYEGRKPDPAPYKTALERAQKIYPNLNPEDCLAIEDDPLGVTSAKHAGMKVMHRKLHQSDLAAKDCDISAFHPDDFLNALKSFMG